METTENVQEIVSMHLIEPKLPDPLTMGANKSNGRRNPVDTSTGHGEIPGVKTHGEMTANATETVRILQVEPKLQNSPIETAKWSANKTNGCGN